MTRLGSSNLARDYNALFSTGTLAGLGDGPLLEQFIARRDEVAFEELLARHGPTVLGICRRWLHDPRDVEDAFQATFLILIRKAPSLRDRGALSSWIYGVALRVVRRARANAARRSIRERPLYGGLADRARAREAGTGDEVLATVDEEIRRLPDNQQLAAILCLREGYTHEAAARELGWPLGTVKSRIAAARRTLARRLSRRGLAPSARAAGLSPGERSGAIPPHLARRTLETARDSLAGSSIPAAGLVRDVLGSLFLARLRSAALLLMAMGTLAWAAPAMLGARPAGEARTGAISQAAPGATVPPPQSPKVDRHGDPLPPGAAMRLGTVRFRDDQYINHVAYSPDGRFVVTSNGGHLLQVWDARGGKKLRPIDVGIENIRDFAFSPDGRLIAAIGFQYEPDRNLDAHYLTFIDVATGRPVRQGECDEKHDTWKVAYAPDGKTVATVSGDATVRLWDADTASIRHEERRDKSRYPAFVFSPDASSHLLAIAGEHAVSVSLWDVANRRDVRKIAIEDGLNLRCLAFSPDGKILAAGLSGGKAEIIRLWRVGDGALLGRFSRPEDTMVYHVAFSPDGKFLAANGHGGWLMLIDIATGKELGPLSGIRLAEGSLAFSPDGRTLATTGGEHVLHFWDVATGEDRLATPDAHLGPVGAFAFLDDGKTLVSGSDDRTVRTWDLATGRPTRTLSHDGWFRSLAVSADGSLLAAGSSYPVWGKVHVWNLGTGQRLRVWPAEEPKGGPILRGMALDAVGSSVIAAWSDGSLRRWDVATGRERPIVRPGPGSEPKPGLRKGGARAEIDRSFFSRDGRSVAMVGRGGVQVVDLAGGGLRFEIPASTDAGEFAPDGASLAIVRQGPGKTIKMADGRTHGDSSTAASTIVWLDSRTGQVRREIDIPESRVGCLAFSPDGEAIAAGTSFHWRQGIIRIFRLRDKREVQTIETPCTWLQGLAFTPDGRRIVAGLSDTSIVIWDVRPAG